MSKSNVLKSRSIKSAKNAKVYVSPDGNTPVTTAEDYKPGELYFVLTRFDVNTGDYGYLVYSWNAKEAARVYDRESFDRRNGFSPVVKDLPEAIKAMQAGSVGATLPFSVLIDLRGTNRAKRWAKLQRVEGMEAKMLAYIAKQPYSPTL